MGRSGRSRGNTHVGDVHTRMNLENGEVNNAAAWSCNGGEVNDAAEWSCNGGDGEME